MPLLTRFLDRLGVCDNECWYLDIVLTSAGYASMSRGTRSEGKVLMHRWAYEFWVGPIPEELDVDHLCRNRWCVNPDHQEPVTRGENLHRGRTVTSANAAKTHCPRGHELPPYVPGQRRQCWCRPKRGAPSPC